MQDTEASQIPSGSATNSQVEDEEGEDDEREESDRGQPSRWSVSSLGDGSEVDRSVRRHVGEDVTVQVGCAARIFCRSEDAWFDGQVTAVHALGRVSVEFEVGDGIRRKTLSLTSAKLFVEPGLVETDPGKPLARAQAPLLVRGVSSDLAHVVMNGIWQMHAGFHGMPSWQKVGNTEALVFARPDKADGSFCGRWMVGRIADIQAGKRGFLQQADGGLYDHPSKVTAWKVWTGVGRDDGWEVQGTVIVEEIPDEQRHRGQRAEEAAEQHRLQQAAAQRRQQETAAERRRLQQNLADKQRRLAAAAEEERRRVKLAREAAEQRRQQESPERRLQQQVPVQQHRLAAVAETERRRVQLAPEEAEQRRLQEQHRPQPEAADVAAQHAPADGLNRLQQELAAEQRPLQQAVERPRLRRKTAAEQPRAQQQNVQGRQNQLQQTQDMKKCDCCLDDIMKPSEGLMCPTMAHFFSKGCLQDLLRAFKTVDYAVQKRGKGRVLCPMKESEDPFGDAALAAHVPQKVFNEYLQVRIKVAETDIQQQMEKENKNKLEDLKKKLADVTSSC